MRPARKGPENDRAAQERILLQEASMRPARKGPENSPGRIEAVGICAGFNEAGPQGAGKLRCE